MADRHAARLFTADRIDSGQIKTLWPPLRALTHKTRQHKRDTIMDIVKWNTGRLYTAQGQPMYARPTDTGVLFADLGRSISGFVATARKVQPNQVQQIVMRAYDRHQYENTIEAFKFMQECLRG